MAHEWVITTTLTVFWFPDRSKEHVSFLWLMAVDWQWVLWNNEKSPRRQTAPRTNEVHTQEVYTRKDGEPASRATRQSNSTHRESVESPVASGWCWTLVLLLPSFPEVLLTALGSYLPFRQKHCGPWPQWWHYRMGRALGPEKTMVPKESSTRFKSH